MTEEIITMAFNYGVLGIWTATLLMEKIKFQQSVKKIIDNNTKAMAEVKTVMLNCKK